jgi:3-oxoacyl-[acyl-carrier-protein] synthase-3
MGQRRAKILGLGTYVPDRVVTNNDMKQWMETSDEWIVERTGIRERRWVEWDKGLGSSDLGVEAAKRAVANSGVPLDKIQMVIFATLSPDIEFPGTGVFLQRKLGLRPMPVLDIRQQCTGFVYALSIADQYVRSGMVDYVLVVGAEVHSTGIDISTRGRDVAVLFGDAGGAAVVGPSDHPERGILSAHLYADGTFAEELCLEGVSSRRRPRLTPAMVEDPGFYPKMNGRQVFKHAVTRMPEVVLEACKQNGVAPKDLGCLIPHQANLRINEFVQKALGLRDDQVHNNIQKYGNTTAATIPLCLEEAIAEGKVKPGDLVCAVAFGAGFTWGSLMMRW